MLDPRPYIERAIKAGPFGFIETLVDGANDYSARISAALSGLPSHDLPLIIACMEIYAKVLRGQLPNPEYVDFLVRIISEKSDAVAFVAHVARPREEDKS